MKVALVTSKPCGGAMGGNDKLVSDLRYLLTAGGHEVQTTSIVVDHDQGDLATAMRFRAMDYWRDFDVLVALRWPAHLVQHHRKVSWFQHHAREHFDLLGCEFGSLASDPEFPHLRDELRSLDDEALDGCVAVWSISETVKSRLTRFNGLRPDEVVLAGLTPWDLTRVRPRASIHGKTIVCLNRITPIKRQHLVLEALAYLPADFRVVFVGGQESNEYGAMLRDHAKSLELSSRVSFLGSVTERAKWRLLSKGACLVNAAFQEDSSSYPVLEAAVARIPIIVCADGGGLLEFVEDGVTGSVAAPEAIQLAAVIDQCVSEAQSETIDNADLLARLQTVREYRRPLDLLGVTHSI
jgi:glycosyltransferase involved in cell wall biosynthesis